MIAAMEDPVGTPTDPMRFSAEDLLEREIAYGRSMFDLQFQLDCRVMKEMK